MNKPSLGLTMIVRDVAFFIQECLESILHHCDEIIIVDTGSEDETTEVVDRILAGRVLRHMILEFTPTTNPEGFLVDDESIETRFGIPGPFSGKHILADFGRARQLGWEALTTDYALWIDSDDLVINPEAIRPLIEKLEAEGLDAAMIPYEYAHDRDGKPTMIIRRERLVRRASGARWHQRIHETLHPLNARKNFDDFKVVHRRDKLHKHDILHRNLKVLSLQKAEEEAKGSPDPRTLYYLAQEWGYLDKHKALPILKEYVRLSGWDEERAVAHNTMGKTHEADGDIDAAFLEFSAAAAEFPGRPEGLFGCARCCYFRAQRNEHENKDADPQWRKCIEYTRKGLAIVATNPPNTLPYDPQDRNYEPYRYLSYALIKVGNIKEGLEAARAALAINTTDQMMLQNQKVCEAWLNRDRHIKAVNEPVRELATTGATTESTGPTTPTASITTPFPFPVDLALDSPPFPLDKDQLVTLALQLWKTARQEAEETITVLTFLDSLPASITNHEAIRRARRATLQKTPDGFHGLSRPSHEPSASLSSSVHLQATSSSNASNLLHQSFAASFPPHQASSGNDTSPMP